MAVILVLMLPKNFIRPRRSFLLLLEEIAYTPLRMNIFRVAWICLDLLTKTPDMDIHCTYISGIICAPYQVQQILTVKDLIGVRDQQLKKVEEDIANSRKYYNGSVKAYNNKCQTFPSSFIAGTFRFEPRTMFEVSREEERENVKVEF